MVFKVINSITFTCLNQITCSKSSKWRGWTSQLEVSMDHSHRLIKLSCKDMSSQGTCRKKWQLKASLSGRETTTCWLIMIVRKCSWMKSLLFTSSEWATGSIKITTRLFWPTSSFSESVWTSTDGVRKSRVKASSWRTTQRWRMMLLTSNSAWLTMASMHQRSAMNLSLCIWSTRSRS